jgi:hypothetical protein
LENTQQEDMTMRSVAKWAFGLLACLVFPAIAQAQIELVNNGGFETGTFAGWTTFENAAPYYCYLGWVIENDFSNCIDPFFNVLDGSYSAANDFDGPVSQFALYQDITIPIGAQADFSFLYRLQFYRDPTFTWSLPRTLQVQVRNPGTGAVLGTLYTYTTPIPACCGSPGSPVDNSTKYDTNLVTVGPVDVSAWAGQTVRLYFFENIPQGFTGGATIYFDDISVLSTLPVRVNQTGGSTNVVEGGAADTFQLTLPQAPTGTVTSNLVTDGQCTVNVNPVVFAAGTTGPVIVTVRAQDNIVVDGPHTCAIQLQPAISADANYNGSNPADIVVNVADNDGGSGPDDSPAPIRSYYTTATPGLSWSHMTGVSGYEIQVDSDPSFSTPLVFSAAVPANTLFVTTTPLSNGVWYWRARAKFADGTSGGWSVTEPFIVDAP